jgi:hypothetical protein
MMIKRVKLLLSRINGYISVKYTLIYFSLMAVLYLFSLFGSMFGSTDFTYADF